MAGFKSHQTLPALCFSIQESHHGPLCACVCDLFSSVFLFCFVFQTGVSCSPGQPQAGYLVKDALELLILLPPLPRCWDNRCMSPCLICCHDADQPRPLLTRDKPCGVDSCFRSLSDVESHILSHAFLLHPCFCLF